MRPGVTAGMTVVQAQFAGGRYLRAAKTADPGTDARVLLAHSIGVTRDRLILAGDTVLSDEMVRTYQSALEKRASFVPVSHITGQREFYGHKFVVGPDVLDPRPETELLVDVALEQSFQTMLDLGTGSGCILLSLLLERPGAAGIGIEKSVAAAKIAATNRDAMGLAGRADLQQGDWFDGLTNASLGGAPKFDLIVSNPPYISIDEMAGLQPEVRNYEPSIALTDGGDGLTAYRVICNRVMDHLETSGRLIVEIGHRQGGAVQEMFTQAGLTDIEIRKDLNGLDRVVIGHNGS
ncbi:MAG: peptide chain release factor N(5)-glutamine methyltransferase [Paracoccaceae bacterium]